MIARTVYLKVLFCYSLRWKCGLMTLCININVQSHNISYTFLFGNSDLFHVYIKPMHMCSTIQCNKLFSPQNIYQFCIKDYSVS
jgi:hypothetical protein